MATHGERMKEWRERNGAGDCERVANELLEYIETVLVPVGKAVEIDPADFTHTGMHPNSPTRPGPAWPVGEHRFQKEADLLAKASASVPLPDEYRPPNFHHLSYVIPAGVGPGHTRGKLPSERVVEIIGPFQEASAAAWKDRILAIEQMLDERLGRG